MADVELSAEMRVNLETSAHVSKTPLGVTERPLQIVIEGRNETRLYRPASLKIDNRLNGRNTATLQMVDDGLVATPAQVGEDIRITWNAETIFRGSIESLTESDPLHPDVNFWSLRCVNVNHLAERFLVATTYEVEGQFLRDIVRDLVDVQADGLLGERQTDGTPGEGVTAFDFVQRGPPIGKIPFNYKPHAKCFDELAELTGFVWWIDNQLRLHFVDPVTQDAPIAFDDSVGNYRSLTKRGERKKYRNRQFFRGGTSRTEERHQQFVGDGKVTTWTLEYPADNVESWDGAGQRPAGPSFPPRIDVNGQPQSVGIRGADNEADFDFVYQRGSEIISQNEDENFLQPTDLIEVWYYGQFPVQVDEKDEAEVDRRQAVEGGTGEYHSLEVDEDVDTSALAQDITQGLLRRWGFIPTIVTVVSNELDVDVGQLVQVTDTQHGIDAALICTRKRIGDISRGEEFLRAVYQLEMDERYEDWVEFWRAFVEALGPRGLRENDRVIIVRAPDEYILATDDFVSSVDPIDLISGTLDPYSWNWYGQDVPCIGSPTPGYDTVPGMVQGFSRHGMHPNA